MNKDEAITYLNSIRPFINLKAVCEDYNRKGNPQIDYNNLRAVLNGVSESRLSESRISSFIDYLFNDLYLETFKAQDNTNMITKERASSIIFSLAEKISKAITEEQNNEFST